MMTVVYNKYLKKGAVFSIPISKPVKQQFKKLVRDAKKGEVVSNIVYNGGGISSDNNITFICSCWFI